MQIEGHQANVVDKEGPAKLKRWPRFHHLRPDPDNEEVEPGKQDGGGERPHQEPIGNSLVCETIDNIITGKRCTSLQLHDALPRCRVEFPSQIVRLGCSEES